MRTNFDDDLPTPGLHVAIIMDGNGRWATGRGLPRVAGHRAGVEVVRRIVEAAPNLGITTLTLYAFSSDNWQRPRQEVTALMKLFQAYLLSEAERCVKNGVRLNIVGRRDRFQPSIVELVEKIEAATTHGEVLHLRVAVDYSARDAIVRAARRANNVNEISREKFSRLLAEVDHASGSAPDVDLLIRTGGEQRLSDFLLWECAYAELFFLKKMWPEFTAGDLEAVLKEFRCRERRFGRVPAFDKPLPIHNDKLAYESSLKSNNGTHLWDNNRLD
jgi:undecaprenyl diphosphate synthase